MYIKYQPAGNDEPEIFPFVPGDLNTFDSEAIESVTGLDWDEFEMKLKRGNTKARRAALWVCLRRIHRGLKFSDVSFKRSEVEVQMDKGELRDIMRGLESHPDDVIEGVHKDTMLLAIERQIGEAPEAPDVAGKAYAGTGGTNTPSP
jgi:hypothetical protein